MLTDRDDSLSDDLFLLLTARCSDESLLTDENSLIALLGTLVDAIDMKPLQTPYVCAAVNNPGLEAYVPIDASNITISTYTIHPRMVICIHSCRRFSSVAVISVLTEIYGCYEIKHCLCRESEWEEVLHCQANTLI